MNAGQQSIRLTLQQDILRLQGFKSVDDGGERMALGPILQAFPRGQFPEGAIHEFVTTQPEEEAATRGFMSVILSQLAGHQGIIVWISRGSVVFPPALQYFQVVPHHVIFVDVKREADMLWTLEEALRCETLSCVVAELHHLDFISSRRLQLAVEKSRVTGLILHKQFRQATPTACVSRWRITPIPGDAHGLPGMGVPQWRVELLRVRNGTPGIWDMQWAYHELVSVAQQPNRGVQHDVDRLGFDQHKQAG